MFTVPSSVVKNKRQSFSYRAGFEIIGSPSIYNALLEFLLKALYHTIYYLEARIYDRSNISTMPTPQSVNQSTKLINKIPCVCFKTDSRKGVGVKAAFGVWIYVCF